MTDFFELAIRQAKRAKEKDEVPIGAVLVKDGKVISRAYNQTEKRSSFLAHAEMLCIERATKKLKTKYLVGCTLYVSLEPCRMCQVAAGLSRIESIFYLIDSKKFGSKGLHYRKLEVAKHKHEKEDFARGLLRDFFQKKR